MIEQLEQLLALRTMRAGRAQTALAQRSHALSEIAAELDLVNAQRLQIDQLRAAWEGHWRRWLSEDRVLHHGQEYNLYHVKLSAWQREIDEQCAQIEARHRQAEQALKEARMQLLKMECQSDVIRSELRAARKTLQAQQVGIEQDSAIEEMISHRHANRPGGSWVVNWRPV